MRSGRQLLRIALSFVGVVVAAGCGANSPTKTDPRPALSPVPATLPRTLGRMHDVRITLTTSTNEPAGGALVSIVPADDATRARRKDDGVQAVIAFFARHRGGPMERYLDVDMFISHGLYFQGLVSYLTLMPGPLVPAGGESVYRWMWAQGVEDESDLWEPRLRTQGYEVLDDGVVHLPAIPNGNYRILGVRNNETLDAVFDVSSDTTKHGFRMSKGRTLRGRVMSWPFGSVAHPYHVFVQGWAWLFAEVDAEGIFTIDGVPNGLVKLIVASRDPKGGYVESPVPAGISDVGMVPLAQRKAPANK